MNPIFTPYKQSITILIFLFSISSTSVAQKGSLNLGISFLYNTGMVSETDFYTELKSISGFSSMLKLEYEPINRVRVSYGIGNLTKGYSQGYIFTDEDGDIIGNLNGINRLSYLSNQITIGGRIGNKLSVLPEFGVSFDALLKQEETFEPFENLGEEKVSNKEYYANWNTSLVYGLSIRYLITEKINLALNFKISNGLDSIIDDDVVSFIEGKPTNYLMGVAFIWRLNPSKE